MKKQLFIILILLNITGYSSTISCNVYLNSVVAVGSAGSFAFWITSTLRIIQNCGISTAIQTTHLPRVMLNLLTVGNMAYAIMKEKGIKDNPKKFMDIFKSSSNNAQEKSWVYKTSMAISLFGGIASFLCWGRVTLNFIQGFANIRSTTLLLSLALDILTVIATGKIILK